MKKNINYGITNINKEIEKLSPVKAELYKSFIDREIARYTEQTFISQSYNMRQFIINVDPLNRNEKYILEAILTYRTSAWHFYQYLYNINHLGNEYRFLNGFPAYSLIENLCNNNLSVKNVICCNINNYDYRKIVSTNNRNVICMVENYYDNVKKTRKYYPAFIYYITSFLDKYNVNSYEDLNDTLIENCILNANDYIIACHSRNFLIHCILQIKDKRHFKKYPVSVLSRARLAKDLFDGYRTVLYNQMDSVPTIDKWLLLPNGEEKKSTQLTSESVISIDFTIIQNKRFRQLVKKWFWASTSSIITSSREVRKIAMFLNMFFPDNKEFFDITQTICANYKSYVQAKWPKTETRNNYIYPILSFIRYLDDYTHIIVEKECYLYLVNRGSLNQKGAVGVKNEHLEQIAGYINDHKNDNHNSYCFYIMFHIALNTEFRASQIVSLPSNCIKESMKANEFVINTNMKQSGYESVDQPCARVVKDIIFAYLNATDDYRSNLPSNLRKYLFIHEDITGKIQTPFNASQFSKYIKNVCEKLGLPRYTAKNLRITYITNAKAYAQRKGLSDLTLLRITNHANMDTINNHYIQEQIIDALQATIGVVIGNVNIDGTISANSDGFNTAEDALVANGLGFCQSMQCTNQGLLPCQRCKYFFTTIENIPYYRKEIKRLKAINNGSLNPHDAEDINNLIRMNTYILGELINLKTKKGDRKDGVVC